MSLAISSAAPALAFGVDPTRRERYSLRQARYQAIGEEVGTLLAQPASAASLSFLDVGVWNGVSMRYIEKQPGAERVQYHGVDLHIQSTIYKPWKWSRLVEADLLDGLPGIESNRYDVVLCEQVLEHLPEIDTAMASLWRVLKPGGTLIVGVPIFPPGLDLARKHLVPKLDQWIGRRKHRGHLQAFSRPSFLAALERNCDLDIQSVRGFRILSGGILRPLENFRWWWQFGRLTGRLAPGLCTEVQVVGVKR